MCRLALVRRQARARHHLTGLGKRARGGSSRKFAAREREPWLLAASMSLSELWPPQSCTLYTKRMQIEQSFRDLKSHRYGSAFDDTLTYHLSTSAPRDAAVDPCTRDACRLCSKAVARIITARLIEHPELASKRLRHSVVWLGWESPAPTRRTIVDAIAHRLLVPT